jgi:hypothetical protein
VSEVNYHKSATRDIRPFFGAAALEQALQAAQIRLYEDQPFTDATAFTVEEQDAGKLSVALRPNLSEEALSNGSIARGKLALAITAYNPFLKRTVMIHKAPLTCPAPLEVVIGAEALERLGGGSRMTVEVALCLAKRMPKQAGNPFLQGHWLSKKSFDLRPPTIAEDFGIDPMDDAGWKAMGMPAKTLYFVQYYSGVNEPASKDRPMAKVLIHADAYKKLSTDTNAKMAKPLMAFLAAEIPCQILAASVSEWKDSVLPELRSPLHAFLKRINRIEPCTLDQLRGLVEQPGMPRLRAILHADQHSVRQVAEA